MHTKLILWQASQVPVGRQEIGIDIHQTIVKAPADVARIANDPGKTGLERVDQVWILNLIDQASGAGVDGKQAAVERRADVAIGVGADHALFDVIQHEVDDGDRVGADSLEVVQGLARCTQLQAGVAPVGVEDLADDLTIGLGHLLRRGGEKTGSEEDLVVSVKGVQLAQQLQHLVLFQALEVGFEVGEGGGGHWARVIEFTSVQRVMSSVYGFLIFANNRRPFSSPGVSNTRLGPAFSSLVDLLLFATNHSKFLPSGSGLMPVRG